MILRLILGVVAGAILGGAVGYAGRCAGGQCPLTCNPLGGLLFGALIGGFVMTSTPAHPRGNGTTTSTHMQTVRTSADLEKAIQSPGVLLVDFYADWCGPCRHLKPVLHGLAERYANRVTFLAVNTEEAGDAAQLHGVRGIPDVRIFKDGRQVKHIVGLNPESVYVEAIDSSLQKGG